MNIFCRFKVWVLGRHHLFSVECKEKRFQCDKKELTGLFRLHYDRPTPVLQKTNRFASIIRIVCGISMFVLEIVHEDFCKKMILRISKVTTFRVSFSTEIRAKTDKYIG